MLRLNDDCLCELFKYLHIVDLINLTKTCNHLNELISENILKKKYRIFDTSNYDKIMPKENYEEFIKKIAQYIEELNIATDFQNLLPILQFYTKLKYPNLLTFITDDFTITDADLQLLVENSPKLECLDIGSENISGKYIKSMKNLKKLHLHESTIRTNELFTIMMELGLTHLSFEGKINFSRKCFDKYKIHQQDHHTGHTLKDLKCTQSNINSMMAYINEYKCSNLNTLNIIIYPHCDQEIHWSKFFDLKSNYINKIKISKKYTEYDLNFLKKLNEPKQLEAIDIQIHGLFRNDFAILTELIRLWRGVRHIYFSCLCDKDIFIDWFNNLLNDNNRAEYSRTQQLIFDINKISKTYEVDWNALIADIKSSALYKKQNRIVLQTVEAPYRPCGEPYIEFQFNNTTTV